jgi:hypothetical protein
MRGTRRDRLRNCTHQKRLIGACSDILPLPLVLVHSTALRPLPPLPQRLSLNACHSQCRVQQQTQVDLISAP